MAVTGHERIGTPPISISLRGRPWQRLRLAFAVRWRAGELDRELAAGTSADASDLLSLRAERITRPRGRACVADGLTRAVNQAEDGVPGFTSAVRPNGAEVLASGVVLTNLDRRLRAAQDVRANGMAMLHLLLTEPDSLLYRPADAGALGSYLRAAAAALEPVN
jgi:hypothetical protein